MAHSNPRVRKALANRPSDSSRSTTYGSGRSLYRTRSAVQQKVN